MTTETATLEERQGRVSTELRDRTKGYASSIVRLFSDLPRSHVAAQTIGKQLLRSGTSVAANLREASRARTSAEFILKLEICVQEADESDLWLELLRDDCVFQTFSRRRMS